MWSGWANRPGRSRELVGWIILMLGAGALQLPALGRMATHGVDIVQFELMRTTAQAVRLTQALGVDGLDAVRQQLYIDFVYLVLYGIVLSGACVLLAARAARRGHPVLAAAGESFAVLAVIAAACDAAENIALLAVTFGHTAQPWPGTASAFAATKFILIVLTLVFLLVGVALSARNRNRHGDGDASAFADAGPDSAMDAGPDEDAGPLATASDGPPPTIGENRQPGWRTKWYNLGEALYNNLVTYIPSHNLRAGVLRLFGAKVGRQCTFMRGTTVFGIESLDVGDEVVIGFRCVLHARGGLTIGSNVILSSDVHFIPGHHDINSADFQGYVFPVVIEPYAWVTSRSTIMAPAHIGRGAVVSACSLVRGDVEAMTVVAGTPAKVIGQRTGELTYPTVFRPLFY